MTLILIKGGDATNISVIDHDDIPSVLIPKRVAEEAELRSWNSGRWPLRELEDLLGQTMDEIGAESVLVYWPHEARNAIEIFPEDWAE